MQNIIAVVFKTESEGYQAITEIRNEALTDKYAILQMGLIKRENQAITLCDSFESGIATGGNAALGGVVGSLLGILGGPVGVILMGAYGALAGGLAGTAEAAEGSAMLELVANKLMDGEVAVVALADETDEAALDAKFKKFDAEVARFDAAVVAAELDEAVQVEAEMQRLARKELRKVRLAEHHQKVEAKRAKLDDEFANFKTQFAQ